MIQQILRAGGRNRNRYIHDSRRIVIVYCRYDDGMLRKTGKCILAGGEKKFFVTSPVELFILAVDLPQCRDIIR